MFLSFVRYNCGDIFLINSDEVVYFEEELDDSVTIHFKGGMTIRVCATIQDVEKQLNKTL